jgi:hypothetical protein
MELYPWRFDSIHSHCQDDVNSFLFQFLIFQRILLVARYRARTSTTCSKKQESVGTSLECPFYFRHRLAVLFTYVRDCQVDKILESLASGTSAVTCRYLNTTGSCNQASHTTSQINQLVYNIAYPTK